MLRALLVVPLLLAIGCSTSRAPSNRDEPAPPVADGAWSCFVIDPKEPDLPQGNVTHTKQRLIEGRLETANVHVQNGQTGSTRLVYRPSASLVGNRLEADFHGVTIVAELHQPDASHWTLHYDDPASGWRFTDEVRREPHGLSITSTDPSAEGGEVETTVRYLTAPCDVVDTAIAAVTP